MHNNVTNGEIRSIVEKLTRDVVQGRIPRDTLQNTAYPLVGEAEAIYFSLAESYLQTDAAYDIMHKYQDLSDLEVLRSIKGNEC